MHVTRSLPRASPLLQGTRDLSSSLSWPAFSEIHPLRRLGEKGRAQDRLRQMVTTRRAGAGGRDEEWEDEESINRKSGRLGKTA